MKNSAKGRNKGSDFRLESEREMDKEGKKDGAVKIRGLWRKREFCSKALGLFLVFLYLFLGVIF